MNGGPDLKKLWLRLATRDQFIIRLERMKDRLSEIRLRLEKDRDDPTLSEHHRRAAINCLSKMAQLLSDIDLAKAQYHKPQSAYGGWWKSVSLGDPSGLAGVLAFCWVLFTLIVGLSWGEFATGLLVVATFLILRVIKEFSDARAQSAASHTRYHKERFHENASILDGRINEIDREMSEWTVEQGRILTVANNAGKQSRKLSETAVEALKGARQKLDEAKRQFDLGALVSFWDYIEKSIEDISIASEKIKESEEFLVRHREGVVAYLGGEKIHSNGVSEVVLREVHDAARDLAVEVKELSYKAQFSPAFAQIYEMRRNTATLVAGFRSIHDAVNTLGERVENSISDLGAAMTVELRAVGNAVQRVEAAVIDGAQAIVDGLAENRAVMGEKLDSIRSITEESLRNAVETSRYSRAALVEGIRSDYEVRVMLSGITRKIAPETLAHVRELYGTLLDPGPRLPRP